MTSVTVGETFSSSVRAVSANRDWVLVWKAATIGMAQAIQSRDWGSKRAFYAIRKQAKGFMETPEDRLLKAIFGTGDEGIPAVPERYTTLVDLGTGVDNRTLSEAEKVIREDYRKFKEAQKGLSR